MFCYLLPFVQGCIFDRSRSTDVVVGVVKDTPFYFWFSTVPVKILSNETWLFYAVYFMHMLNRLTSILGNGSEKHG